MPQLRKDILEVSGCTASWGVVKILKKILTRLHKEKIIAGKIVLSVSFVDTTLMLRLNTHYRKKRKVTDILSFEQKSLSPQNASFLGDLVLCTPVVKKQAKQFQHSIQKELEILLTHGILHLLGYDHERSDRAKTQMARLEKKLLINSSGLINRSSGRQKT
jgi:rRNA maturation RNase YbeY